MTKITETQRGSKEATFVETERESISPNHKRNGGDEATREGPEGRDRRGRQYITSELEEEERGKKGVNAPIESIITSPSVRRVTRSSGRWTQDRRKVGARKGILVVVE